MASSFVFLLLISASIPLTNACVATVDPEPTVTTSSTSTTAPLTTATSTTMTTSTSTTTMTTMTTSFAACPCPALTNPAITGCAPPYNAATVVPATIVQQPNIPDCIVNIACTRVWVEYLAVTGPMCSTPFDDTNLELTCDTSTSQWVPDPAIINVVGGTYVYKAACAP